MRLVLLAGFLVVSAVSASGQELPNIPSDFETSSWIQPAWGSGQLPVDHGPKEPGAFRFFCAPSHLAWDDPIIYPGKPGASPHLHQFYGNALANGNSTFSSLRTTGTGTCQGGPGNRTGYWTPAMYSTALDTQGSPQSKVILPAFILVYYKGSYSQRADGAVWPGGVLPPVIKMPRGLRYIGGFDFAKPTTNRFANRTFWLCHDANGSLVGNKGQQQTVAATDCPVGQYVEGAVAFPNCLKFVGGDPVLDSVDHRSHLVHGTGYDARACPKGYQQIPALSILVHYKVTDLTGPVSDWYLSSDRMTGATQYPGGTTLHGDWFGAWDDGPNGNGPDGSDAARGILSHWVEYCIRAGLSCSGGEIGNGLQLKNLSAWPSGYPAQPALTDAQMIADAPPRPISTLVSDHAHIHGKSP